MREALGTIFFVAVMILASTGVRIMLWDGLKPSSAQQHLLSTGYTNVKIGSECNEYGAAKCYEFEAVTQEGRYERGHVLRYWIWGHKA